MYLLLRSTITTHGSSEIASFSSHLLIFLLLLNSSSRELLLYFLHCDLPADLLLTLTSYSMSDWKIAASAAVLEKKRKNLEKSDRLESLF